MSNQIQLTDAGFKMIEAYLAHKAWVENYKPTIGVSHYNPRNHYTHRDGRIFMTLSPGSGSEAATVRKLVRDGFAEGCFNWCGGNRWMIPTEAGLAAYWEEKMQSKHEDDLRSALG